MSLSEAQKHWRCPAELAPGSAPRPVTVASTVMVSLAFQVLGLLAVVAVSWFGMQHSHELRDDRENSWVFMAILGFVALLHVQSGLRLLRQRRLLARGRATCGTVTSIETDGESSGSTVFYAFIGPAGSIEAGSEAFDCIASLVSSQFPAVGATVTIVHDPALQDRSMLYPSPKVQIKSSL